MVERRPEKEKEQRLKAIAALPATAAFFFCGSPLDRHASQNYCRCFSFFFAVRRSTGTRPQNYCPFAFFFAIENPRGCPAETRRRPPTARGRIRTDADASKRLRTLPDASGRFRTLLDAAACSERLPLERQASETFCILEKTELIKGTSHDLAVHAQVV